MICSSCNHELTSDAHFCSRCGARVVLSAPPPVPSAAGYYPPMFYSRVARHLQTLGLLWLVYAIWRTLTRIIGLSLVHSFLGWHHEFPFGTFGLWPFALGSTLLALALSLLTAYGLMNRRSWGRAMAIICGIFALVHPILGTALGIYTLWVLAPSASGMEYTAFTTPAPTPTV